MKRWGVGGEARRIARIQLVGYLRLLFISVWVAVDIDSPGPKPAPGDYQPTPCVAAVYRPFFAGLPGGSSARSIRVHLRPSAVIFPGSTAKSNRRRAGTLTNCRTAETQRTQRISQKRHSGSRRKRSSRPHETIGRRRRSSLKPGNSTRCVFAPVIRLGLHSPGHQQTGPEASSRGFPAQALRRYGLTSLFRRLARRFQWTFSRRSSASISGYLSRKHGKIKSKTCRNSYKL